MIRIGHGYDLHRIEPDDAMSELILGGVKIPFQGQLIAHSDGDLLLHALTDALLGSLALGDIGQYFPDTDDQFKHADSSQFVKAALSLLHARGYSVCNVDCTVIAEAPKLMPHVKAMRESIASLLKVGVDQVGIKATTHERCDSIGRREAIAAHCVVLVTQM